MSMETLVVGGGGREHAIAEILNAHEDVSSVLGVNENLGIFGLSKGVWTSNASTESMSFDDKVVSLVESRDVGLVVIGPEAPIIGGLGDRIRAQGRDVFAPSAEAAQMTEGSKIATYEFNERWGITQPNSVIFRPSELETALKHVSSRNPNEIVIKADGLAGGKGVILPDSSDEAATAIMDMLAEGRYDGAGKEGLLVAERYHGPEVSVFVITDGTKIKVLPFAQDHKRIGEGDTGLNTGGMGAYAPLSESMPSRAQVAQIEEMAQRVVEGMAHEGVPYQGCLYMGLMLAEETGGEPAVIEYNCRFGDPEAQVVLPLLQEAGVDTFELLRSAAEGNLTDVYIPSNLGKSALTVCLASAGYPESSSKGDVISGLDQEYPNTAVYHGGTKRNELGQVITNGGRVLYVTGFGDIPATAAANAYATIGEGKITFPGMQYRRDIGWRVR